MSFTIISNEEISILNTNTETRTVAAALQKYISQINHLEAVRDMTAEILLTVDGKTAKVKTDSDVKGNIVCDFAIKMTEDGPVFEHTPKEAITSVPIWEKEIAFNDLVDQLLYGENIFARINLFVTQSGGASYGLTFWDNVFSNGPVKDVTCRLMYREMDMDISYICIGLSGDIVGEIPFNASKNDVSDIERWFSDDVLVSIVPSKENDIINVEELKPYAESFSEKYGLTIHCLDSDEFYSDDAGSFSSDQISDLAKDMKFFRDYAEEHGLDHTNEAFLFAADGSPALAHIYETETGEINIAYCKF